MTLVHAFISSRLDYCNSVFDGISDQLLHRMQVIQNDRVLFVTGTKEYEPVTPVLRVLHRLPVQQWITFKAAVMTYKCLHGLVQPYLAEYCVPTSSDVGRHHLRSATPGQLSFPRKRTIYGDLSFSTHSPAVWNSLPHDLCSVDFPSRPSRKD